MANDIIIQGHYIELGELKVKVYTVMGAQDDLEVALNRRPRQLLLRAVKP